MSIKIGKIILILSGLSLWGCSYGFNTNTQYKDLNSICAYVNSEIEYINDYNSIHKKIEYFQSPIETELLKTGDCEDYTLLFMYLANRDCNIKADMQIVFIDNMGYHAIAYYNNIYYDATNNYIFTHLDPTWHNIIKYDYDLIMIYATNLYTKGF